MTVLKEGELIAFEEGEYSDYGVICFCRVVKDFDIKGELANYLKENPDQAEEYSAEISSFVARLSADGLIEDVDYRRIWLGAYGTFDKEMRGGK